MASVEDQLGQIMRECRNAGWAWETAVRQITERFDLTPKPVVSALHLGKMVQIAYKDEAYTAEHIGERMLDQLASAGLEIVESDDARTA